MNKEQLEKVLEKAIERNEGVITAQKQKVRDLLTEKIIEAGKTIKVQQLDFDEAQICIITFKVGKLTFDVTLNAWNSRLELDADRFDFDGYVIADAAADYANYLNAAAWVMSDLLNVAVCTEINVATNFITQAKLTNEAIESECY